MVAVSFEPMKIRFADSIEVVSLVDNSLDMLSTIDNNSARSFKLWAKTGFDFPRAEHGFSMLIHIWSQGKAHTVLFDTGCSSDGAVDNAKRLGVDLSEVDCIVLSHGHYDHFGGLLSALKAIGKKDLPVVLHKDMLKRRGTNNKGKFHSHPAFPTKEKLSTARLIFTKQPLNCSKTI